MALIIEDGSNVAGANSYVDLADCRTYALARGVTLTAVDADLEVFLIKANDYLESFRDKFKGSRTNDDDQPLQWPRSLVYIDSILFDEDSIPQLLIDAQCQLAIEQTNGFDFSPTFDGGFVVLEQVGPIVQKYSERIRTSTVPKMSTFDALINPLVRVGAGVGGTLRV